MARVTARLAAVGTRRTATHGGDDFQALESLARLARADLTPCSVPLA
jgi:hypothetical protein